MLISAMTFPITSHRGFYPLVDIRINRTSMVPTCFHNPRLLLLTRDNISSRIIQYVAQKFIYAIQIDDQWKSTLLPSPPPTPTKPHRNRHVPLMPAAPLPPLEVFIAGLVGQSGAKVATLLSTLIYLHRFRKRISADLKGDPGTRHRIFLATLIVAAKYLNDSGPKNVHWTEYARCFDIAEVNAMENELLTILNYELRFDEAEACRHFAPLMNSYNNHQNLVRQPTIFSPSSKSHRAPRQAAAARYHRLPLTPPPSEGCISATTTLPYFPPTSLQQIYANTPPERLSRFYRYPVTPVMPSVSSKTGLDGGGDGVPVSTNPSSQTPIGNKKTGSKKMQRQSKQTIQPLPLPQPDEPEPETRTDNNNNSRLSSMFRGVPAAMAIGHRRRKSRSRRILASSPSKDAAAAAAVPVEKKTHEKKRSGDLEAGIAQQRLSATTKPPASSRASKGQLDDLWRKIQFNLSKLALTNASDTEPGISAVFEKVFPGQTL